MAKNVRTGCRDCKKCTNSDFANAGRKTGRSFMAFSTFGMSEVALATRKKCRICGHQLSLHHGAEAKTVQPTLEFRAPSQPASSHAGQGPAEEIAHLIQLRESGEITYAEFESLKARVIEVTPPAGWYPDPQVPGQKRWWDGRAWAPSQSAPSP